MFSDHDEACKPAFSGFILKNRLHRNASTNSANRKSSGPRRAAQRRKIARYKEIIEAGAERIAPSFQNRNIISTKISFLHYCTYGNYSCQLIIDYWLYGAQQKTSHFLQGKSVRYGTVNIVLARAQRKIVAVRPSGSPKRPSAYLKFMTRAGSLLRSQALRVLTFSPRIRV